MKTLEATLARLARLYRKEDVDGQPPGAFGQFRGAYEDAVACGVSDGRIYELTGYTRVELDDQLGPVE
ncbi:MAG TPA: hypothetical protein VGF95_14570 [Solirubrobacteraceae bacterium]|jgi:hypothetical protein